MQYKVLALDLDGTLTNSDKIITPRTKAIMITNPGNPTGTCLTREQMKMILDIAVPPW